MGRKVYQEIAMRVGAIKSAEKRKDTEQATFQEELLDGLLNRAPSGSGFDAGSRMDMERSTADCLVFSTSYHHIQNGHYAGWTDHIVKVTPSLAWGFALTVSGKDKNGIRGYIKDVFETYLMEQA